MYALIQIWRSKRPIDPYRFRTQVVVIERIFFNGVDRFD